MKDSILKLGLGKVNILEKKEKKTKKFTKKYKQRVNTQKNLSSILKLGVGEVKILKNKRKKKFKKKNLSRGSTPKNEK